MKLRYSIQINEQSIPVTPLELAGVKKVTAKEKDQAFYRTKLNGNLVFKGMDFDTLFAIENSDQRCTEIKFLIEKNCAGFWETDWKGYFSCNDVSWDESRCEASVTPHPDDEYRLLLDNYGKEHNLMAMPVTHTATAKFDFVGDFEFTSTTHGQQPDETGTWAVFLQGTYWIAGTGTQKGVRWNQDIHYRLKRTANLVNNEAPDLAGWQVVDEENGQAIYAKRPDLYEFKPYVYGSKGDFTRYPDLIQIPCGTSFDTDKYIDVTAWRTGQPECADGCMNLRVKINETRCVKILWEFGRFDFTRNRTLNDAIRYLVTQTVDVALLPALNTSLSRFFNEPMNYVTERPNTLTGLQIASLSDVIGYKSSEPAKKGEWSLKKLLDALRMMFRVYWDIHEGKIRLEHESFYSLQGERDLTVHTSALALTDAYTYDKEKMPRFQRLLFPNAGSEDFERGVIEYGGPCVVKEEGKDAEDFTVTDVVTDLENIVVTGGTTAQKGFVLMLVQDGQVRSEAGDITGLNIPNAGLSAANLVRDYYTHNRVLENGAVNDKMTIFKSVNKTKKQVPLTVPECCEKVNPYARFISTLGSNATLDTMSQGLTTQTMEYVLLHDTTGSGALELGRQFDDSFDDSFR